MKFIYNKALVILFLFVLLGTIYGVMSYTSAEITNNASLKITSSEDALVAVDYSTRVINLSRNITKDSEGNIIGISYPSKHFSILVTNNYFQPIDEVRAFFSNAGGLRITKNDIQWLLPGEQKKLNVELSAEKEGKWNNVGVKIVADWDDGSAVIEDSIDVFMTDRVTVVEKVYQDNETNESI